jgi:hypothetical protein
MTLLTDPIFSQAFDARWNETEVNHSTTLRKIRAGLEAEKNQLSVLLKKVELERVEEVKTIVRQREEWRNKSHQVESNLSVVASKAKICELTLNTTIENSTKQSVLSDERAKAMEQNFTSTIRDLTRTLSKVEQRITHLTSPTLSSLQILPFYRLCHPLLLSPVSVFSDFLPPLSSSLVVV